MGERSEAQKKADKAYYEKVKGKDLWSKRNTNLQQVKR